MSEEFPDPWTDSMAVPPTARAGMWLLGAIHIAQDAARDRHVNPDSLRLLLSPQAASNIHRACTAVDSIPLYVPTGMGWVTLLGVPVKVVAGIGNVRLAPDEFVLGELHKAGGGEAEG